MRALVAAALLVVLCGCRPAPINPPLFHYEGQRLTLLSSEAHRKDIGGVSFTVAPTGSMHPLLAAGDIVVVDTRVKFGPALKGRVLAYRAQWLPADSPPVAHRCTDFDNYGAIMEGDSVPQGNGEARYRVTAQNLIGEVVGIYHAI
jgi:hypothetical protein